MHTLISKPILLSSFRKPPHTHYSPFQYCNTCCVKLMACPSYFIVHTQSYATLRSIENLLTVFYLNTRDALAYNLTTYQCGARLGLHQL